jgi:hypothetical protein
MMRFAGYDAKPVGLVAPTILIAPPGKRLCMILLLASRSLAGRISDATVAVARTTGSNRSFDQISHSDSVGIATRMRDGSQRTKYAATAVKASVQPTCAGFCTATTSMVGSTNESTI